MYTYYGLPDDLVSLVKADAVRAGERARMLMALDEDEEGNEIARRSVRRRLASTLVQLGVRLDPEAAEDINDDVA